jgi:hypothetical protein
MSGPSSEWRCAGELRWHIEKDEAEGIEYKFLQQKWEYIDGSVEWRDVPVVVEGE